MENLPHSVSSPAQLNAADTQEAPDLNPTNNSLLQTLHDTLNPADNEEALCMSRFRNWLWIDVLEEMQEQQ
ncbi:hypothetical protein C0993_006769 [Termitomyces sp. T159_Od127]|nr:hypothetical protein C0993_006769 [Termitomyces sp. T159_Od127]